MKGIAVLRHRDAVMNKADKGARSRFRSAVAVSVAGPKAGTIPKKGAAPHRYLANSNEPRPAIRSSFDGSETRVPALIYACYATAFLYGLTLITGVVIAYSYRQACETWCRSHYDYQIRIFWQSMGFYLAAVPLTFVGNWGLLLVGGTYLWVIYRVVLGWRCLASGKTAP
jgi:uncharacterized membrane protein